MQWRVTEGAGVPLSCLRQHWSNASINVHLNLIRGFIGGWYFHGAPQSYQAKNTIPRFVKGRPGNPMPQHCNQLVKPIVARTVLCPLPSWSWRHCCSALG